MSDRGESDPRHCPRCGRDLPLAEFGRVAGRADRRAAACRRCSPPPGGAARVEFDELLAAQGGRCAICGAVDPRHLDHDHRTGWVRGILCFNCKGGLGNFRDSADFLAEAITYLKGTTWQRVLIHPGVFQMCSPMRGRPPSRSS
jgi:hypothetical protein